MVSWRTSAEPVDTGVRVPSSCWGVIDSPRALIVRSATVRVVSRLMSVAFALFGSAFGSCVTISVVDAVGMVGFTARKAPASSSPSTAGSANRGHRRRMALRR